MDRADLIEAICRAIHSDRESGKYRRTCPRAIQILGLVEPPIRADERERITEEGGS